MPSFLKFIPDRSRECQMIKSSGGKKVNPGVYPNPDMVCYRIMKIKPQDDPQETFTFIRKFCDSISSRVEKVPVA